MKKSTDSKVLKSKNSKEKIKIYGKKEAKGILSNLGLRTSLRGIPLYGDIFF